MPTPKPSVYIDAPPAGDERAAAAIDLAVQLRQELLRALPSKPLVSRPPLHRLIHHLGSRRRPGAKATPALKRLPDKAPEEPRSGEHIALGTDEVKRLQRLAHMLASLSCELNLLLAGVQTATDEEVDA